MRQTPVDLSTLEQLSRLLDAYMGRWPVFELIISFQQLYKALPEEAKDGRNAIYRNAVENLLEKVKTTYGGLTALLKPDLDTTAMIDPQKPERSISHRELYQFVNKFDLKLHPGRQRVVVALPCGTTMGLACLAVATYYTMTPMTPKCGADQFRADVERVKAAAILVANADAERLQLRGASWILQAGIKVFIVEDRNRTFIVSPMEHYSDQHIPRGQEIIPPMPNRANDVAIILFTSGTSGTKKLVPITLHALVTGVASVVQSWGLTPNERCLNMMPLHHIGGIVRNLFAPIMAGGSTICCSTFDPNLFWDIIEGDQCPTWYYASPSMHASILTEAENRQAAVNNSHIRLVCNAAGGLLPTLATQLHDTFRGSTVLPSYGMTECMPIASPPLTYSLDRPGTSGISAGPEISIQGPNDILLAPGLQGNICVRGLPVFPGYLKDGKIDHGALKQNGWFDTGDMGYMDVDGYLYITGRSKEVINRGGELLSPFEIEEAIISASMNPRSVIHGRVSEALAFSMPHHMLQEVVGVVLVVPAGKPRPSLEQLSEAVKDSLQSTKWPAVIVYMEGLPRAKNKVLRINLAERLDMTPITDTTKVASCYYEAFCPPPETDLKAKISKISCDIDSNISESKCVDVFDTKIDALVRIDERDGLPQAFLFGDHGLAGATRTKKHEASLILRSHLRQEIHGYLVPPQITFMDEPVPRYEDGSVNLAAVEEMSRQQEKGHVEGSESSVVTEIIKIFASVLSCSPATMDSNTDFFAAGGDSLGAGRLLSLLRRRFELRLTIDTLFSNSRVEDIANIVQSRLEEEYETMGEGPQTNTEDALPGCSQVYSSTRPLVLLLHLLPIAFVYPQRVALWWTLFLYGMAKVSRFPLAKSIEGRLFLLMLVIFGCTTVVSLIAPIVGILTKWIIIGRYREGMYPMWASYHNRWWFTQKTLQICGKASGIFNRFPWSQKLYYRLLGAKIGRNVTIHEKAQLGEYDLIEIGDDTILDKQCVCRPFAAERNTSMLLSRISIGRRCTIGMNSIVAPGAVLPNATCIGPNSSSWEIGDTSESNRDLVTANMTQPHKILCLLIVEPVATLAWLVRRMPSVAGLVGMVLTSFPEERHPDQIGSIAEWYTYPSRLAYHFIARLSGDIFGPITLFMFVLFVKGIMDSNWICGPVKSETSMKNRSQMQKLRTALQQRLVPDGNLSELAALFGSHYEIVSILVRALGGRVGKRVYWPGVGPSMQDFELLDIGDDVVFGSRAHLVTSDQMGSARITLGDGCMVADRVVIQAGTSVGEGAVLGSGALTKRNESYPPYSVWVGSKGGECVRLDHKGPDDINMMEKKGGHKSSTPFGRAFYEGQAEYHVLGLPSIICYSLITTICVSLYWNTSTIVAMKTIAIVLQFDPRGFQQGAWYRPFSIQIVLTASIAVVTTIQAVFALVIIVGAKWSLMGRRAPGSYDWDKSSYCQRWQIFLTIERLRRNCYRNIGIMNLLTSTHYAVMYFRALGASIGKDCALFANGKPSLLFTEPDLLTLGDRVSVDNASLVSHINSRGHFKLNRLEVGNRSVLRAGSRLLSGASIGEDACLLEHTLVVAGDHVEAGDTHQGWPGSTFAKNRC
ncbi:hypothetical protein BKA66DRAFT_585266 [Pyrenochaeta sp. MPI-SDFR-AT-0127]|nr:hypothetical protein BKA66DRAFT_585266 [Pyrenochaeta sp. MPI-SDFR-AT-0127]